MRSLPLPLACALALVAAGPAAGQASEPEPGAFVICYPNAPGTTASAQGVMRSLGEALTERTGRRFSPTYFNEVEPAREYVRDHQPRFGIVSLDVYLRWRDEHGLVPIAQTERDGATEERYTLLVAQDSPAQELEDLTKLGRPARIWSSHLDDRRFAGRVVFAGELELEREDALVQVVSTDQPLRALRRLKANKPFKDQPVDAVLVDATTWAGLQKLKSFQGAFRVLYTSPPLPTPPVVAFEGAPEDARLELSEVLSTMAKDAEGQALLKTLQLTAFRPADEATYAAAREAYGGEAQAGSTAAGAEGEAR